MPSDLSIEIIYHRRDSFPGGKHFKRHAHPYWQLEIALSGQIRVEQDSTAFLLDPGDLLFIPPQRSHSLHYLAPNNNYLSLKYRLAPAATLSPHIGRISRSSQTDAFTQLLTTLLPAGEHSDSALRPVLSRILEALLLQLSPKANPTTAKPPLHNASTLAAKVLSLIEQNAGRQRRLADYASQLGLSETHLSTQFKAETGATLKAKIDEACMRQARFLLAYSDQSISQITTQLAFPDLYAFSRFFKNRQGQSPRAYRLQQRQADTK